MQDNGNLTFTECLTYFAAGFLFAALGFFLAFGGIYLACINV